MAYYDRDGGYDGYGWRPYVSQDDRRRQAAAKLRQLRKAGHEPSPVEIEGRKIATTFWGKAWCENLERYSDYENRLPRGRTYVRNGSVMDLRVEPGKVTALVSGSEIYEVAIKIASVPPVQWRAICARCAGGIDSLVELLQGRFSDGVMAHLCQQGRGLFPTPKEIDVSCSCPDWASMCKHVAAVLYGIGARLDRQPELLFRLREVDAIDLIARAGEGVSRATKARKPAAGKILTGGDLGAVFGVEIAANTGEPAASPTRSAGQAPVGPDKRTAKRRAASVSALPGPAPEPARSVPVGPPAPALKRARISAASRKAVAERMKRYWAQRRRAAAPRAERGSATTFDTAVETERRARRRPAMSVQQRNEVSERMKRYWEVYRRAKAALAEPKLAPAPPPIVPLDGEAPTRRRPVMSVAQRKAVSERMKRYWEERRAARKRR